MNDEQTMLENLQLPCVYRDYENPILFDPVTDVFDFLGKKWKKNGLVFGV